MKHSWRFIDTEVNNGFINMAIDEAILEHYIQYGGPPTIRVYRWHPPALSLGASQSIGEINLEQCRFLGIDIVRRPTGGKAVLHDVELTYSLVASSKEGFPNSIWGVYNRIAQGLINAYRMLGVEVQIKRKGKTGRINQVCFLTATSADLLYDGRKVIGSAQKKKGDVFLQHGSLVISHDPELLFSLFNYPSDEVRKKGMTLFMNTTASLNSILGRGIHYEEIKQALWQGFQEAWEIDCYKGELANEEIKLKHKFLETKYLKSEWNYKI